MGASVAGCSWRIFPRIGQVLKFRYQVQACTISEQARIHKLRHAEDENEKIAEAYALRDLQRKGSVARVQDDASVRGTSRDMYLTRSRLWYRTIPPYHLLLAILLS
jgi:hypothetical protein